MSEYQTMAEADFLPGATPKQMSLFLRILSGFLKKAEAHA